VASLKKKSDRCRDFCALIFQRQVSFSLSAEFSCCFSFVVLIFLLYEKIKLFSFLIACCGDEVPDEFKKGKEKETPRVSVTHFRRFPRPRIRSSFFVAFFFCKRESVAHGLVPHRFLSLRKIREFFRIKDTLLIGHQQTKLIISGVNSIRREQTKEETNRL
jgi:hypothetical protein